MKHVSLLVGWRLQEARPGLPVRALGNGDPEPVCLWPSALLIYSQRPVPGLCQQLESEEILFVPRDCIETSGPSRMPRVLRLPSLRHERHEVLEVCPFLCP
jgi:hypothetical protein